MDHPNAPDFWRKDFLATLRLIGSAAAQLPYGVQEPVLGGPAAVELYSGGLWPTRQLELLTMDVHRLKAELVEAGFRQEGCSHGDGRNLRHPWSDREVCITMRRPIATNVVAIDVEGTSRLGATTIRVVGIEDLIAEQIIGWLRQGGRRGASATLIQVLVELGRAGVAGRFRPAYLQRRLAHETGGEALLELPFPTSGLDDPLPRRTSLAAIASVAASWRTSRGLPLDETALLGNVLWLDPKPWETRAHPDIAERTGLGAPTAQIIPFRSGGQ